MPASRSFRAVLFAATLAALPCAAAAQPFEFGPRGSVPGSSFSGARIDGLAHRHRERIPNADVFGDTVRERAYGRAYDDGHTRPEVRRPPGAPPVELRAREGRSTLDTGRAGVFAISPPGVASGSGVTRPTLGSRRSPGGRAAIRP